MSFTKVTAAGIGTTSTVAFNFSGGLIISGVTTVSAGTTAAPSITPTGDSNTGIFFPSADTIAFGEGGVEAARFDSSGRLGIGTQSPGAALDITNSLEPLSVQATTASRNYITHKHNSSGDIAYLGAGGGAALSTGTATDYAIRAHQGALLFGTNGDNERARIDSSGRLLVGTSSARANFFNSTFSPLVQFEGANNDGARLQSFTYGRAGDNDGPIFVLAKHRSNSVGGNTTVASGDQLGWLSFQGNDGTEFVESASIRAEVDGTPGADDMPGRLVFSTTADGASSPTERMRLDSSGNFGVGLAGGFTGTSNVFFPGAFTTTTANAANVNVAATTGLLARSTSSIVYKTQVEDLETTRADAVLSLRPVWYRSLCEGDKKDWSWYGLIAEEVAKIEPRLVFWRNTELVENEEGEQTVQDLDQLVPEGVMYDRVTVLLLDVVKRQQQKIEALEARLTAAGI